MSTETITFGEFKMWLQGLIRGKNGALPDTDDWKEIKKMLDKVSADPKSPYSPYQPFEVIGPGYFPPSDTGTIPIQWTAPNTCGGYSVTSSVTENVSVQQTEFDLGTFTASIQEQPKELS